MSNRKEFLINQKDLINFKPEKFGFMYIDFDPKVSAYQLNTFSLYFDQSNPGYLSALLNYFYSHKFITFL
jgi:hypothetical protein